MPETSREKMTGQSFARAEEEAFGCNPAGRRRKEKIKGVDKDELREILRELTQRGDFQTKRPITFEETGAIFRLLFDEFLDKGRKLPFTITVVDSLGHWFSAQTAKKPPFKITKRGVVALDHSNHLLPPLGGTIEDSAGEKSRYYFDGTKLTH